MCRLASLCISPAHPLTFSFLGFLLISYAISPRPPGVILLIENLACPPARRYCIDEVWQYPLRLLSRTGRRIHDSFVARVLSFIYPSSAGIDERVGWVPAARFHLNTLQTARRARRRGQPERWTWTPRSGRAPSFARSRSLAPSVPSSTVCVRPSVRPSFFNGVCCGTRKKEERG